MGHHNQTTNKKLSFKAGDTEKLVREYPELMNKVDFIETVVIYGNGFDLDYLIQNDAYLPDDLDKLLELSYELSKNGQKTYWREKITLLARRNIMEPTQAAKFMHKLMENNIDPALFITAKINWLHYVPKIQIRGFVENSNSKTEPVIECQFLLDALLCTQPTLFSKIPEKSFNVNIFDYQGLTFLHKLVQGTYTTDTKQKLEIFNLLAQRNINPLLRTPQAAGHLTAKELATKTQQLLLAEAIEAYENEFQLSLMIENRFNRLDVKLSQLENKVSQLEPITNNNNNLSSDEEDDVSELEKTLVEISINHKK